MKVDGAVTVDSAATVRVADTVIVRGSGRVVLGRFVTLEDNVLLDTGSSSDSSIWIGNRVKVKYGAVLRTYDGWIRIGARSSVGEYSVLAGHGGLSVGSAAIIAGHCYLSAADHIYDGRLPVRFQGESARGIEVGDGAWLGARCVVLDGVVVGTGCVVGAGAVVTKSLRADTVCFGVPCREVRARVGPDDLDW